MPLRLVVSNTEKLQNRLVLPPSPVNDAGVDAMLVEEYVRAAVQRYSHRSLQSIRDYEAHCVDRVHSVIEQTVGEKFWSICVTVELGILIPLLLWLIFGSLLALAIGLAIVCAILVAVWGALQPPDWQDMPIETYAKQHGGIERSAISIMQEVKMLTVSSRFVASTLDGKYVIFYLIHQNPTWRAPRIRIPFFVPKQK